jgi:hypothetical protein
MPPNLHLPAVPWQHGRTDLTLSQPETNTNQSHRSTTAANRQPPPTAGIAYAPILATRMVLGKLARPAVLAGTAVAAARGAARLLQLRGVGPAQLLRRLACGAAEAGAQLDALLKVAVQAGRSERFRRAFIK